MTSEPVKGPRVVAARAGFTIIELMVVVAIIVMASGVMGPTLMDFMRNPSSDQFLTLFFVFLRFEKGYV